jgi:hypothetical protein
MKMSIALLPAFFALTAVPSLALPIVDTTPAPVTAKADLRGRFNAMVDELAAKAAARKATREDFARVVEELRSVANEYMSAPRAQSIREKAITRMNELEVRARDAMLTLMEFDVIKDLEIDMELEGVLQQTMTRAREGKATRLEWAMYTAALSQRAEAAQAWNPEIDAIVGRLRTECDKLAKRAGEALKPADFDPILTAHADLMCQGVTARLSKRALQPKPGISLNVHDYDDVKEVLIHYGVPQTSDFLRKVEARVAEIKAAVEGGRITRAECDALCTLLMQRARAAATSG